MPAIFLGDDHPVIRASFALLIELEDDLTLAGEAPTAAEALDAIPRLAPDLVVGDVQLPDMHGVDLVTALLARLPGQRHGPRTQRAPCRRGDTRATVERKSVTFLRLRIS